MFREITDIQREHVKDDLTDRKEANPENNVAKGPTVIEGVDDEDDLEDHVGEEGGAVEDEEHDPEGYWVEGVEGANLLEGCDGEEGYCHEHHK